MRILQTTVITLIFSLSALAQNAALMPSAKQQFYDGNGRPISGGCLYSYTAGTSTPQATYTDSTLGTPNANPVVLDAAGRANVWLSAVTYKFVLGLKVGGACPGTPASVVWTQDSVADVGQILKRDLASTSTGYGAGLVGFKQVGAGAAAGTVQGELAKTIRVSQFSSFAAAINAATGKTLLVDSVVTFTTDFTAPPSVAVQVGKAGLFKVATGSTLTLNGPFSADLYQAFSTDASYTGYGGRVVVGKAAQLYPQWWGAKGDGSADDTAALLAMSGSIGSGVNKVHIPAGTYNLNGSLLVSGLSHTEITCDAATLKYTGSDALNRLVEIRGDEYVTVDGCNFDNAGDRVGIAVSFRRVNDATGYPNRHNTLSNFTIKNFSTGVEFSAAGEVVLISENTIQDGQITNCTTHVRQTDQNADLNVARNVNTSDYQGRNGDTFYDIENSSFLFERVVTGSGTAVSGVTQFKFVNVRNIGFAYPHLEIYQSGVGDVLFKLTGTGWITVNGGYTFDYRTGMTDLLHDLSAGTTANVDFHNVLNYRGAAGSSVKLPDPNTGVYVLKENGAWPYITFSGPTYPEMYVYPVTNGYTTTQLYKWIDGSYLAANPGFGGLQLFTPAAYQGSTTNVMNFGVSQITSKVPFIVTGGTLSNDTLGTANSIDKLISGTRGSGTYSLIRLSQGNDGATDYGVVECAPVGGAAHPDCAIDIHGGNFELMTDGVKIGKITANGEFLLGSPLPASDGVSKLNVAGGIRAAGDIKATDRLAQGVGVASHAACFYDTGGGNLAIGYCTNAPNGSGVCTCN